ncbi:putative pirin-related protein [Vibrio halioticoli NBRC 102217]|uniref:Putative pirin-related protein n=1 Tax=Vibrio halioticoli NBRC 102217 TaxID=1219072 RepID=V5FBK4_9VIBR|nr:pirin family protein [Vibrio halioticoli]GAD88683.1 putative pirin-related protein [Vibrio halioticoli NBRC 102217]
MNTHFTLTKKSDLYYMPSSNQHPANTYFHFSFANYYDPNRMNFGALRVFNDDDVKPHSGFERHPHRDMEIVSYIIHGQLTHWDSVTKKEQIIGRGHVQAISAGAGVWHSELNKHNEWVRFLQIWVTPNNTAGPVRYNHHQFELADRENKLLHIVGNPDNKDASPLYINSDVNVYVSEITNKQTQVEFELKAGRQAYISNIEGAVHVEGYPSLQEQDTLELSQAGKLKFTLKDDHAHFIIIEMAQPKNL